MSELGANAQLPESRVLRLWGRIPVLIRALVSGIVVMAVGVWMWPVVLTVVPAPWSVAVMVGLLWVYWKYFSGSWAPKSTQAARRKNFRAVSLSRDVWIWGLLLAALLVVVWHSTLVVTFRFIEFPADLFVEEYRALGKAPPWVAWLVVIMTSIVAGICEETGFRGYMQVPLESRYGPTLAIAMVTGVFLVVHLHQAWAAPIVAQIIAVSALIGLLAHVSGSLIPGMIGHVVLDIINFSYWWTDLAGHFDKRPIAETGVDTHAIVWTLILAAATVLFLLACRKIWAVRRQAGTH